MCARITGNLNLLLLLLFQGLQYIHSMHLVHLDIKPENIFITFPESTTSMDTAPMDCITADEQYVSPLPVYKIGEHYLKSVSVCGVGDCYY